jgi:hypothetical protein
MSRGLAPSASRAAMTEDSSIRAGWHATSTPACRRSRSRMDEADASRRGIGMLLWICAVCSGGLPGRNRGQGAFWAPEGKADEQLSSGAAGFSHCGRPGHGHGDKRDFRWMWRKAFLGSRASNCANVLIYITYDLGLWISSDLCAACPQCCPLWKEAGRKTDIQLSTTPTSSFPLKTLLYRRTENAGDRAWQGCWRRDISGSRRCM